MRRKNKTTVSFSNKQFLYLRGSIVFAAALIVTTSDNAEFLERWTSFI